MSRDKLIVVTLFMLFVHNTCATSARETQHTQIKQHSSAGIDLLSSFWWICVDLLRCSIVCFSCIKSGRVYFCLSADPLMSHCLECRSQTLDLPNGWRAERGPCAELRNTWRQKSFWAKWAICDTLNPCRVILLWCIYLYTLRRVMAPMKSRQIIIHFWGATRPKRPSSSHSQKLNSYLYMHFWKWFLCWCCC